MEYMERENKSYGAEDILFTFVGWKIVRVYS